jgi:MFS family permease
MRAELRRVFDPLLPVRKFNATDRQITIVMWLAGLVQGFAQSQASAGLPFTRVGLGLSEGEMSLMLGVARLAGFAALGLGWLGDHTGRRRPFLIAITLVVLGGAGAGLVAEAWQFGVLHAVLRTGTAAVSGLAIVILAETASAPVRAYSISFYGAAVSLGSGLALIALPLADGGGEAWRIPHLLSGVGLAVIPLLALRLPETRVYSTEHPRGGHWRELVSSGLWQRRFWIVVVVNLLAAAFGAVGAAFSTERMISDVGLETGQAVWILLLGGTLGGVGFFIGGHLADSWGRRSTSILSLLLALAGGLVVYSTTTIPLIVIGAMVSAFGTFAFVPAGGSHRAELFPTRLRSSANTAVSQAALVGSALGLISGIYTMDALGLSNTIFILGAGVAIAATLTALLPETRGQDLTALSTETG